MTRALALAALAGALLTAADGDRFRVLEPGSSIPSGACPFTDFTPYTKVK